METIIDNADTKHKTILINRTFDLPLSTVWRAWTEPASFKKWWGPNYYNCPYCEIDLKPGGKYLVCMRDQEGNEVWSTGNYKEIVRDTKLVLTDNFSDSDGNIIPPPSGMVGDWSKQLLITVEMEAKDGKTDFLLKHEGMPTEMHDDCLQGWNESLDKLENNLK